MHCCPQRQLLSNGDAEDFPIAGNFYVYCLYQFIPRTSTDLHRLQAQFLVHGHQPGFPEVEEEDIWWMHRFVRLRRLRSKKRGRTRLSLLCKRCAGASVLFPTIAHLAMCPRLSSSYLVVRPPQHRSVFMGYLSCIDARPFIIS